MPEAQHFLNKEKLPTSTILAVTAICVAPFILNLFGLDFGSKQRPFDSFVSDGPSSQQSLDYMFHSLSGSFTHTILEWSAFCSAIFTVVLSFCLFYVKRNISIPIVGVALFCAGCMDAFHTLAADRLIEATADNHNLIPFTWAVSRMFNAFILIVGIGFLAFNPKEKYQGNITVICVMSLFFGLMAYWLIQYCANSNQLPETLYPYSLLTRPWDIAPLVLYLISFLYIFPKYYSRERSFFSHAMLISCIPNIFTQIYMAFGSSALFDNGFNVAHFLKILSYLVPFLGIAMEFVKSLLMEAQSLNDLEQEKNTSLKEKSVELKAIMQSMIDPLITIDFQGRVETFNPAAEKVFGYYASEVIGQNVNILMPDPYQGEHGNFIQKYHEPGAAETLSSTREVTGKRRNGTLFPMDLSVNELKIKGRTMYVAVCRDITERKKAEEELADNRAILEKEYWLKTGLADLHEKMRGDLGEADLSQSIINYIAGHLNVQIGAVYLYKNGKMRFVAGYAYNQGMKLANQYKIGEGLVGQAALEKKSILVTNVPDNYIRIQSGLVDTPPRNILVTPIILEEDVIGVMELASLDEFQEDQRDFLDRAMETIAINLKSANSRARLTEFPEHQK